MNECGICNGGWLVCTASRQYDADGSDEDGDIQPQRPVADIPGFQTDPLRVIYIVPTAYLPKSGYTGPHYKEIIDRVPESRNFFLNDRAGSN